MRNRYIESLNKAPAGQGLMESTTVAAVARRNSLSLKSCAVIEGMAITVAGLIRNHMKWPSPAGKKLVTAGLTTKIAEAVSSESQDNVRKNLERAKGIEPSYAAWENAGATCPNAVSECAIPLSPRSNPEPPQTPDAAERGDP